MGSNLDLTQIIRALKPHRKTTTNGS